MAFLLLSLCVLLKNYLCSPSQLKTAFSFFQQKVQNKLFTGIVKSFFFNIADDQDLDDPAGLWTRDGLWTSIK